MTAHCGRGEFHSNIVFNKVRVWTVHPKYLDPQGLVALWRETLLAQKVLRGETKGYRNHPQLIRFRACPDPLAAIAKYLSIVADEAARRGYCFDREKIAKAGPCHMIQETDGQLAYEWQHLKAKLAKRNTSCYDAIKNIETPDPHPLFTIITGDVRDWEKR